MHDPLCPYEIGGDECHCHSIANARADEREAWLLLAAVDKVRMNDLRAEVVALHAKAEVVGLSERAFAYEVVLKLLDGSSDAPAPVVRCRYCGNVQASISDRAHHEASQHGAVFDRSSDGQA